jgi:hypothetical protein
MTSRLRAAVTIVFAVFAVAFTVDGATATPAAARPDFVRLCRF